MRRSLLEIRIEILENSTKNIKPTHLMRATNLSYHFMLEQIKELKTADLIEEIKIEETELKKDRRTKINYRTTTKGANTIKTLKEAIKPIG